MIFQSTTNTPQTYLKMQGDKMPTLTKPKETDVEKVIVGSKYVTMADAISSMKLGRTFASLLQASSIHDEDGWYWISDKGITKEGYFIDNRDGYFKEFKEKGFIEVARSEYYSKYEWTRRLYVSKEAAESASKGKVPLALHIWEGDYTLSRLVVDSGFTPESVARVVSTTQLLPITAAAAFGFPIRP